MRPLARSLLALAAAALFAGAGAAPELIGNQCAYEPRGDRNGPGIYLPTVYIAPGVCTATIDVPNVCGFYVPIGELVRVCDEVQPTVVVPDTPDYTALVVHRHGHCRQTAVVEVTLWCYD